MKTFECGHCGKPIYPTLGQKLYRTCDAYVCNTKCQKERVIAISKIDPKMENPLTWKYDISKNDIPIPMKRKGSLIGLQDLENCGEKIPLIEPNYNDRDGSDIVTVTFDNAHIDKPPNKPYEYIIFTLALAGTAILLLTL